ncbi:MAG: DUF1559 domain-containing protein [Bacteroidales bacterium]|nr:DUF1559 domain-containing protein [Bacteroidales bacterium]
MNRLIGALVLVLIGLIGAGLFLTGITQSRVDQGRLYCQNHLRILSQFAAMHENAPAGENPVRAPNVIPPGTVPHAVLSPEQRLAWTVPALLTMDQRTQDTAAIFAAVDLNQPWSAEHNLPPARTRILNLICPGNPTQNATQDFQWTQYVGITGIGADSANLGLGPPVPPNAGCWRYDGATPFSAITDGLSSTMLFAETTQQLGPWLAGGTPTLRGLLVTENAPPFLGGISSSSQFGGNHPGGGNCAFADGSVRWLQSSIDGSVLRGLVTIAGDTHDPIPGE